MWWSCWRALQKVESQEDFVIRNSVFLVHHFMRISNIEQGMVNGELLIDNEAVPI